MISTMNDRQTLFAPELGQWVLMKSLKEYDLLIMIY